jgi:hypothetical protein
MLILFLGLRHPPPDDVSKIGKKDHDTGGGDHGHNPDHLLSHTIVEIAPDHSFDVELPDGNETTMLGNVRQRHQAGEQHRQHQYHHGPHVMQVPHGWSVSLFLQGGDE